MIFNHIWKWAKVYSSMSVLLKCWFNTLFFVQTIICKNGYPCLHWQTKLEVHISTNSWNENDFMKITV